MANNERETLLQVEHLCQYFGSNKAVDDVSFDIKKGEVFGLVGESGCGKTTTGRSIIKIYNITSGSIYFKDQRICAGPKSYQDEIARLKGEIKRIRKEAPVDAAAQIQKLQEDIAAQKTELKKAMYDHKHCDAEYAAQLVKEAKEKYAPLLEAAQGKPEYAGLQKEYKNALRVAKKTKLITKIQMIFQDPIASLNPRMTVKEIISEGMVINGIKDKAYIDEKVYEILEMVGLVREHAGRYPHEFSGGQRQRIGEAGADHSVHRPRPFGRQVLLRPDRGHVLRQDGGIGRRRRAVCPSAASVYPVAAIGDPAA